MKGERETALSCYLSLTLLQSFSTIKHTLAVSAIHNEQSKVYELTCQNIQSIEKSLNRLCPFPMTRLVPRR